MPRKMYLGVIPISFGVVASIKLDMFVEMIQH